MALFGVAEDFGTMFCRAYAPRQALPGKSLQEAGLSSCKKLLTCWLVSVDASCPQTHFKKNVPAYFTQSFYFHTVSLLKCMHTLKRDEFEPQCSLIDWVCIRRRTVGILDKLLVVATSCSSCFNRGLSGRSVGLTRILFDASFVASWLRFWRFSALCVDLAS